MLDSDLAKLYKCKNGTKTINQAVKRNINKFPENFYFQLNEVEFKNLKSQFGTSSSNNYGGIRKMPFVFTEHGVAMLASVINTPTANDISVKIINAFVTLRHAFINNINYQKEVFIMQNKITNIDNILIEHNNKLLEHDGKIESIIDKFSTEDIFKDKMIFKGEFYDGFSLITNILNKAKKGIIVIDNYCDKEILSLICNLKVKVFVISNNMNDSLIDRYQKQYNNLTIIQNNSFHDRFIIIDKEKGYHLGSSIKDIGKKISYIDTIEDKWLELLLIAIKNKNTE